MQVTHPTGLLAVIELNALTFNIDITDAVIVRHPLSRQTGALPNEVDLEVQIATLVNGFFGLPGYGTTWMPTMLAGQGLTFNYGIRLIQVGDQVSPDLPPNLDFVSLSNMRARIGYGDAGVTDFVVDGVGAPTIVGAPALGDTIGLNLTMTDPDNASGFSPWILEYRKNGIAIHTLNSTTAGLPSLDMSDETFCNLGIELSARYDEVNNGSTGLGDLLGQRLDNFSCSIARV